MPERVSTAQFRMRQLDANFHLEFFAVLNSWE